MKSINSLSSYFTANMGPSKVHPISILLVITNLKSVSVISPTGGHPYHPLGSPISPTRVTKHLKKPLMHGQWPGDVSDKDHMHRESADQSGH